MIAKTIGIVGARGRVGDQAGCVEAHPAPASARSRSAGPGDLARPRWPSLVAIVATNGARTND